MTEKPPALKDSAAISIDDIKASRDVGAYDQALDLAQRRLDLLNDLLVEITRSIDDIPQQDHLTSQESVKEALNLTDRRVELEDEIFELNELIRELDSLITRH